MQIFLKNIKQQQFGEESFNFVRQGIPQCQLAKSQGGNYLGTHFFGRDLFA